MVFSTETRVLMHIYLEIIKFNLYQVRMPRWWNGLSNVLPSQKPGFDSWRVQPNLFLLLLFFYFFCLKSLTFQKISNHKLTVILCYALARSMTNFKYTYISAGIYVMLFANSVTFHMLSVDLLLKQKYILAFFYWKVYVDLKYHTTHILDYCIFKAVSCIYNLNILYIALRVEINSAILSSVSVIDTIKLPQTQLSPQPHGLSTCLNSKFLFNYIYISVICRAFLIHGLAHRSLWSTWGSLKRLNF